MEIDRSKLSRVLHTEAKKLSKLEWHIFCLLGEGLTIPEIAEVLRLGHEEVR